MDRYRTSLNSTSPINRSNVSEGYVKSNLESRIEYENSQVSLITTIKVLLIIGALFAILLGTQWVLQRSARSSDGTRNVSSSTFATYLARMRYNLLGGENPDKCEHHVVSSEDTVVGHDRVHTVTETTTCSKALDKATGSENSRSFWNYLRLPFFGCEEYKQHEAALKDQKFSVNDNIPSAPRFEEITKIKKRVTTYNDTLALSPEHLSGIEIKFSELLPSENTAHEAHGSSVRSIETRQINAVKPLLENKTIFDLQLKVNDLVNSYKNLQKKRESLNNFRKYFFSSAKSPSECTTESRELTRKIEVEKEKHEFVKSNIANLELGLNDAQNRLSAFISRQKTDDQEPLKHKKKLEDEIEDLKREILRASRAYAEIDVKRRDHSGKISEIDRLRKLIDTTRQEIQQLEFERNLRRNEVEDFFKNLKISEGKRTLWEMKLELALRNKHIKDYLMTLVNTSEGKQNDLQALFVDKIASEEELKTILKEFIRQSKGPRNELPITDEQIDIIIKQDKKDFEDITRLYKELAKIIAEHKDIDFNISTMRTQIETLTRSISEYQKGIDAANKQVSHLDKAIKDKADYINSKEHDVAVLLDRASQDEAHISRFAIDIPNLERVLQTRQGELELLNSQFKVIL